MFTLVPAFVCGIVFVILGITGLGWWAVLIGLIVVVLTGASLYVTAKGHNPWWNQSSFDRPGEPAKAAVSEALRARRDRQ